jgi:hypothetical protein
MKYTFSKYVPVQLITIALFYGCSTHQTTKEEAQAKINIDAIHAGEFDTGKMWTFDFPPVEYFSKTYGFTPTKEWFEKARLSALRLPNCTASFVSEDGLVMTNHHCARAALDTVTRAGERLAENGFYASTLAEERRAANIYVDQLIVMEDVTLEVQQAFEGGSSDEAKIAQRLAKIQEIQKRSADHYKTLAPQDSMIFNVVSFYDGGRFSLYGYKRYTDVRLVFAPEAIIAFFGGDPDNFTYPRYDFDCAFFRVYENGQPLKTDHYFRFSPDGAKEGDAVFVIGNPGSTNRLETMAQLKFRRDYVYPARIETYQKFGDIYSSYIKKHPDEKIKYMNKLFGYDNSRKAFTGYLHGLLDPVLMAKKKDFEKKFRDTVSKNSILRDKYSEPWSSIEQYQAELNEIYEQYNALKFQGRTQAQYLSLAEDLVDLADHSGDSIRASARATFFPSAMVPEIEKQLLAFRLKVLQRALGNTNDAFNKLLSGRTPDQIAEVLAETSCIGSKEKTEALLLQKPDEILKSTDPLIQFMVALRPTKEELEQRYEELDRKLQASVQILGKVMYEIYGTHIPPDATFTLRIADGTVKGYDYNGTIAPPITTFFGLYDRSYSFGLQEPWNLPERWVNPPASFKLRTPMNFVSTNDIIGGNSGSPIVNKDLQIVGLIFDGNMESLPGNTIYDESSNRSVSVHSSGILEGLEQIYRIERITKELRSGSRTP